MATSINMAIAGLVRRAEQSDFNVLINTFVDTGMISSTLRSKDHQIIYDRRGTGKTHALNFLVNSVEGDGNIPILIDLRTVGSNGSIYNDESLTLSKRVSHLLIDVGNAIHDKLQENVLKKDALESDKAFTEAIQHLENLSESLSSVTVIGNIEETKQRETSASNNTVNAFGVSLTSNPHVDFKNIETNTELDKTVDISARRGRKVTSLRFGNTHEPILQILAILDKRLVIMFDEWSTIPEDLQPYLADMLKRCFMPARKVTVKIAAIEQRTNFLIQKTGKQYIGLELGSDISADINLDDFMVFDNNPEKAAVFFGDLFYKHIKAENNSLNLVDAKDFIKQGFTQSNAFNELVKAAEGVPRDAINIAILAAQSADGGTISVPIIRSAARRWYQRDKERAISANERAEVLLRLIVNEVIGTRRARAFLVSREVAKKNELLKFLYDSRVLHILKQTSSAKDQPGERFTVYKIDYGCYVELLNTAKVPKGLFDTASTEGFEEFVDVPQDDYRSIRRAILDADKLLEVGSM